MATGATARPIEPDDWQTVDPGDWQTVGSDKAVTPKTGPGPWKDQYGQPPVPSATERYGSSLAETTGIPQMIDAAKNAPPQPITPKSIWEVGKQGVKDSITHAPPVMAYRLAKSILQQSGQQLGKAYDSVKTGDYPSQPMADRLLEAAGHVGGAALPIVGPMAAKAGEQIGSGDVAGGLGTATGAIVQAVSPSIASGVSKTSKAISGAFEADPTVAIVKALKPVPSAEGFTERLPDTLAHVKASVPYKIGGNQSLISATQKAIDNHQAALESWMAPARQMGTQISGDPIVRATQDAIPDSLWREDPASAQTIIDQAHKAYGGQVLDVDSMRTLLKEKNAELNAFYSKAEGKQHAAVTSGKPEAVVKAQRDAIAESLYQALDPQNAGAGPRLIQRQTGDMIDLLNASQRRKNSIIAEKPVSTAGAIGTTAARLADIPGKLVTGKIEEAIHGIPQAWRGISDPLIKRAFNAVGDALELPKPQPSNVAGLLPGAPLVTPPPTQRNPVTVTTGTPLTGRMISAPVRKMPSIPDASGVNVTTGQPLTAPLSRQLSAGPTVRTIADTGGKSGDLTGKLIPVYDNHGKLIYYSQPGTGRTFMMPPGSSR